MPHNFLVIRWSGMGDIIMTLPAIKWLKDHFTPCRICYLTDTAFAAIPEQSGLIDRIESIDRRGFASASRFFPAVFGTLATLRRLRQERVDMAFDLQGFGETAVLAYLSGASLRVGRVKNSPLRKRLYNIPIHADWVAEHRSRYFVRAVAEACGHSAPSSIPPPRLPKPPAQTNTLRRRIVGFNIGASTESRRWSEQNFFELAKRLSQKGVAIRLLLGPQEAFLMPAVQKVCGENNWEFSLHRRLEPLIHHLSECCLLVANDTGPGHLAAALGIPVITLFSTGGPENVRPLADRGRYFRNENDINQIRVGEVENVILEFLAD